MHKLEKLTRLFYCLQGCYNETAESIDSNLLLTNDERNTCKFNIFILRKILRERIMERLQIHDAHIVNDWVTYLLSIDAISDGSNQPIKPTSITRYRINPYAIQVQLKTFEKLNPHTHTLDKYLPVNCGSPDHQESLKDEPLIV